MVELRKRKNFERKTQMDDPTESQIAIWNVIQQKYPIKLEERGEKNIYLYNEKRKCNLTHQMGK